MEPRIRPLDDEAAPEASRAILRQTKAAVGMVPNLHRTLAHSPAALRAYTDMARALAGGRLPAALREQIALATAGLNGCAYCASAHTAIGKGAGVAPEELSRNLAGESSDAKVGAVLQFVRELVAKRGAVSDAELRTVREAGFDDAQIAEIAAHVGLNSFTTLFNVMARTEIDFPPVALRNAG